jgi:hypothetical protein
MNEKQRVVKNRLRVLEHAKKIGNIRKTCRYFGIADTGFIGFSAFDAEEGETPSGAGPGLEDSDNLVFAGVTRVPAPAAIWLFGTGMIGLVGFSKRRKAS